MTEKLDNLLPCPFCGAKGKDLVIEEVKSEDDPTWTIALYVKCRNCYAQGRDHYPIGWCESEQAAIEGWNDRYCPSLIPSLNPDRLMISVDALMGIHRELLNIEYMTSHISDLLTPIQQSVTKHDTTMFAQTPKEVKLKIKKISYHLPLIKDELQLAYEAGLRDGARITHENVLASKGI